ncbi:MAG: hypothetical protein ACOYNF_09210, partial [Rhodoferax sp.]
MTAPARPDSEPKRMPGLFAPGMQLMGNLQFAAKALLICLMFMLPIAWLTWSFYRSHTDRMAFSAKELHGVRYNQEIYPLINLAQQWRRDATAAAAANGAAPATLQDVQARLKQAQEKLAAVDRLLGPEMNTAKLFQEVQGAFARAQAASGSIDLVFEAHTRHITALINLMTQVTDASNLTLDPDIDSYYLMDASYFKMPDILESTGKLRGIGLGIMQAGAITPAQLDTLNALMPIATFQFSNMRSGLTKSYAFNPGLASRDEAATTFGITESFYALARNGIIDGKDYAPDTQQSYLALGNMALDAQFALLNRFQDELHALLNKRLDAMRTELIVTTLLLLVCLVLVAYLFYSFFLVTRAGLNTVNQYLHQIAQGELMQAPARPTGRDEPAQVLQAVIDLQAVLAQFRAAQAELARQHDAGMLDYPMSTQGLPGDYAAMAESINQLVQSHIADNVKTIDVVSGYTEGRLDVAMPRLPGQKARVSDAIDKVQAAMNEAALAATFNERIRLSLDSLPVCVTVSNAQAQLVHATPPAKELLKIFGGQSFDTDKFYGNKLSSLFKEPAVAAQFDQAVRTGATVEMEVNGHKLRLVARPVHDSHGTPIGRITQWLDHTDEIASELAIDNMVNAASSGDFSGRLSLAGKSGFFGKISAGMNQLVQTSEQGLTDVARLLEAFAQGDLTQRITHEYQGLFARVKESANTTAVNLTRVMDEVRDAAVALTGAANQVSATAQSLSQAASEQAASVEESTASITLMSASINQNSDNAKVT